MCISIHALREEGDYIVFSFSCQPLYFYPRPPRGGRRPLIHLLSLFRVISIHALREEGDKTAFANFKDSLISIHALREEGDRR